MAIKDSLAVSDVPTLKLPSMEATLPALVWLTRHTKNCLNGDHEPSDFACIRWISVDTPVQRAAVMCVHCRCLIVEKEE